MSYAVAPPHPPPAPIPVIPPCHPIAPPAKGNQPLRFDPADLHVITPRSNPLGWAAPHANWLKFAEGMIRDGVTLTVVECAYGSAPFECHLDGARHIGVRARTRAWNKENLLNIGLHRTPEARYVAWIDADVGFHDPDWAVRTLDALQHYEVVQPWSDCYDLGPRGEHIAAHKSFCHQYFHRQPMVPAGGAPKFWQGDGGPHVYPHSGYAWACRREVLDATGGLFELGGMGSGDHHMALALIGEEMASIPGGTHPNYIAAVKLWGARARRAVNYNVGFVPGTISHWYHGRKPDRNYLGRWDMFVKHQFDPFADLIRNSHGVIEFAPEKPELRHDFDRYLQARNEDINSL